ncbi:carbohydrate-binding protein [Streptomyces xiamenensis]
MSAGSQGRGTPEQGDDPFGYLYRPEGGQGAGQSPAPQPPPSYHQVRPVGERTFAGQRGQGNGHGQQDAHYAAPETQGGGSYGGGGHGGRGRGRGDQGPPKRNGLLIGAIAVVAAVVVGVGAAIIFSSGGDDNDQSQGQGDDKPVDPTGDNNDDDLNPDDEDPGDENEDEDGDPDAALPTGDITDQTEVTLSSGATLESNIPGARSDSGAYVGGMNNHNATVTWTVDFEGEPGEYYFNVGYTLKGEQSLSFAVNSEIRNDKLTMKDYMAPYVEDSDGPDKRWTRTYRLVNLEPGENTFHIGCTTGDKCDVYIDQLWITKDKPTD